MVPTVLNPSYVFGFIVKPPYVTGPIVPPDHRKRFGGNQAASR